MSDGPHPERRTVPPADLPVGEGDDSAASTVDRSGRGLSIESPGQNIGPYKLLSPIGEGGFGTVWLAERREPMVQRVAIKIIKPGMDSREVIARFEQERQALAVMDHPNVARVLDAGSTPPSMGARPYFVMEYVKGEPITKFCDRHRLTIRQRLELFIPVCEAIQHAHHRGIIHRDIKPSNVLVVMVDTTRGNPASGSDGPGTSGSGGSMSGVVQGALVKVIDFGVAKATVSSLTDKTIYTETGRMIGTPEYMSPEQAEMSAAEIDTRTDVYSLGVLLYELLTGRLPFDSRSLRAMGRGELQRVIREVDPPRPSTRIAALGVEAEQVAAARVTQPRALQRELSNELEWIPLKAMRKERLRRYETAVELARDVQRYLNGQALVAGPEGSWYRAKKFLGRNRAGVSVALMSAVIVFLAPLVVVLLLLMNASRAKADAQEALKQYFLYAAESYRSQTDALAFRAAEQTRTGAEIAEFMSRLATELAEANATPGVSGGGGGGSARAVLSAAAARLERGEGYSPRTLGRLRLALAELWVARGEPDRAESLLSGAVAASRESGEPETLLAALEATSVLLEARDNALGAAEALNESVQIRERLWPDPRGFDTAELNRIARMVTGAGNIDLMALRDNRGQISVSDWLQTIGPSASILAERFLKEGRFEDAERYAREALSIERQNRSQDHPGVLARTRQLAEILQRGGSTAEAGALTREADDLARRIAARRGELAASYRRLEKLWARIGDAGQAQQARAAAERTESERPPQGK